MQGVHVQSLVGKSDPMCWTAKKKNFLMTKEKEKFLHQKEKRDGLLVSHKKEWNIATGGNIDKTRDDHTSEVRER